jgi:hypothetical protein
MSDYIKQARSQPLTFTAGAQLKTRSNHEGDDSTDSSGPAGKLNMLRSNLQYSIQASQAATGLTQEARPRHKPWPANVL